MGKRSLVFVYVALITAAGCGSTHPAATSSKTTASSKHAPATKERDAAADEGSAGSAANDAASNATSTNGSAGQASSAGSAGHASGAAGSASGAAGGAAGSVAPQALTVSELPDALGASVCDALVACVGSSVVRELTQREECMVRIGAQLRATEFAYIDQAVSSGHVAYDPSQLSACMAGIRALECDVLSHTLPAPCSAVIDGKVALDGECTISAECDGAAFCSSANQCPSHCVPLLNEGDACSGDNQCADDLLCGGGHCLRPSQADGPCNGMSGAVCRIGFTCLGSTDVDTGHCLANAMVQVGAEGDTCEPGGALCKEGLSCVYAGNSKFHCEQAVGSGASCHLGLPGQCPNGEYCDTNDPTVQSTCRTLPSEGKTCVLSGLCAPALVCVVEGSARVCRAIQDNCGACSSDAMCRSEHCEQGYCAPPPACGMTSVCP